MTKYTQLRGIESVEPNPLLSYGKLVSLPDMTKYVVPKHTREEINLAGKQVIDGGVDFSVLTDALNVVNNWRTAHAYPLNAFYMTLSGRARKIDAAATLAQRLKRLPSIMLKLVRFPTMKLYQMQDLGGCRAVLKSVAAVREVVDLYKKADIKKKRHQLVREKDYIGCPKTDGYRGIHLVYKYHSGSRSKRMYNGQQIEIQIRSRLQHAWATAVESVQTFSGQALKSSGGDERWRRFFALASSAFALREKMPLVPGMPDDPIFLIGELRDLALALNVDLTLNAWRHAIQTMTTDAGRGKSAFLLVLDTTAKLMNIRGFSDMETAQASEAYLAAEKALNGRTDAQAVLVSVRSARALKKAYPNYFLDTKEFIDALAQAVAV